MREIKFRAWDLERAKAMLRSKEDFKKISGLVGMTIAFFYEE